MLFKVVLLFILLTNVFVSAQVDPDFPKLVGTEFPDTKITRTGYYDGEALWGLINGGADIYLEYGFDKLLLQEIEWRGVKFRVEFYRMKDAKAAFGIFSVSRYKCALNDTLTKFVCITPFQVQAAIGKIYISIANDKGNQEAQNLTTVLFKNILTRVKKSSFKLPAAFKSKAVDVYKNQMKFMRGTLGLQNGFPAWIDMFDNFSNYEIYLLPIELEKGYAYISQIKFQSKNELQIFINGNKSGTQNNISKTTKLLSANEILFIESNLPDMELKNIFSLVNYK